MKSTYPVTVSKCCNSTIRADRPISVQDMMDGFKDVNFVCDECGEPIDIEHDVLHVNPYIKVSKGVYRKDKSIKNYWQ